MHDPINRNFDLPASLNNVGDGNRDMIDDTARICGAFAGFPEDESTADELHQAFARININVILPTLAS